MIERVREVALIVGTHAIPVQPSHKDSVDLGIFSPCRRQAEGRKVRQAGLLRTTSTKWSGEERTCLTSASSCWATWSLLKPSTWTAFSWPKSYRATSRACKRGRRRSSLARSRCLIARR